VANLRRLDRTQSTQNWSSGLSIVRECAFLVVMDTIAKIVGAYIIAWLIAVAVDLWPRDQVHVFGMYRQTDRTTGQLTPWRLEAPWVFRVEGQTVLRNVGGLVSRQENCDVFDLNNWNCSYKDGSGQIAMRDGQYWESRNESELFPGYEYRNISQFTYHIERCKMWARSSALDAMFGCATSPFLD